MESTEHELLKKGAKQLGLNLSEKTLDQLLAYLALIVKWNKAYNLTAIRNPAEMLKLHLLDSLVIAPLVFKEDSEQQPTRLIDVGTGAGLPGVVLAILNPSCFVSLLDTNGKKCRFLNQVKIELGLSNISIIHHRVESFQPEKPYNIVLSRAFATLKDMTDNAHHLLQADGCFLAMKGKNPQQEIDELDPMFKVKSILSLNVPEVDAERHLVEIVIENAK